MSDQGKPALDTWGVVELMGHVRMGGKVTEEERFGCKMGRIDVPLDGDKWATVYFGGQSVYRFTPTGEAEARAVAAHSAPQPVHRFEMPQLAHADPEPCHDPDDRLCSGCGQAVEDCECDQDEDEIDEYDVTGAGDQPGMQPPF